MRRTNGEVGFPEDPRTALGKYMRSTLTLLNLSPSDVAAHLGVTQSAVSHWMEGRSAASPKNFETLLQLLESKGGDCAQLKALYKQVRLGIESSPSHSNLDSTEERQIDMARSVFELVEERYERWQASSYSLRGGIAILDEDFDHVNAYFDRFSSIASNKLAFLFRCAIQNGMGGKWGHWLSVVKHNVYIVDPLLRALTADMGERPAWRSAVVLEKIFAEDIFFVENRTESKLKERIHIGTGERFSVWCNLIKEGGVESYLLALAKDRSTDSERRKKIVMVLDEIEAFYPDIAAFSQDQSIRNLWLRYNR